MRHTKTKKSRNCLYTLQDSFEVKYENPIALIDLRTFVFTVRNDDVLDMMDDSTNYKDDSKANDTVIFETK